MSTQDATNFKTWYTDTLTLMYPRRESGLAVFLISLPLLERYLRQKNKVPPTDDLSDACMTTLRGIFGSLRDNLVARRFWSVYRNGFLHQATLSWETRRGTALPIGRLTHDCTAAVLVAADGTFLVNPVLFSQQVVATIESDFATFEDATVGLPLPAVQQQAAPVGTINIPLTYLGTGSR